MTENNSFLGSKTELRQSLMFPNHFLSNLQTKFIEKHILLSRNQYTSVWKLWTLKF